MSNNHNKSHNLKCKHPKLTILAILNATMFSDNYQWHHDYARVAFDAGFSFETHTKNHSDKFRINLIDIDRVIKQRDIKTVDQCIPSIIDYVLDPEKAQVLDETFVKTFRLGQLSIQYLLYCKKYLDNTVILLKKDASKIRQENNELKLFVDDLKQHVASLMDEVKGKSAMTTFKCEECNKVFSTEEFLISHKNRRHNTQNNNIIEAESEKLHTEIKELKGRLNSAEKLIQKEQESKQEVDSHEKESKLVNELYQKFENLKLQVGSELKLMQNRQDLEEKYEKLLMMKGRVDLTGGDLEKRRESTTQTDSNQKEDTKKEENVLIETQKQIAEFGDALETKVCSSLQKIEEQMQSFWSKLQEMEQKKITQVPEVPPRTKYLKLDSDNESTNIPQEEIVIIHDSVQDESEDDTNNQISSELNSSQTEEPIPNKATSNNAIKKQSMTTLKNFVKDTEIMDNFRVEIEKRVMAHLQELGVSPNWKGLPSHSFQQALKIVNHQSQLIKKTYPDYNLVEKQIEKKVSHEIATSKASPPEKTKMKVKSKRTKMVLNASDSEMGPNPYSAVIKELKSATKTKEKGVLKNYPSVASLTKKRVLFDLESKTKPKKNEIGSTTSIDSAVLDGSPKKHPKKDIEEYSDFSNIS